jgi:FKBP-type peptidyl-prolyl cis-trans isomerase FkpA
VRIGLTATALLCVVALTSCGSDTVTGPQSPETITFAASLSVDLNAMTRSSTGLYTRDLTVGTGATAVNGKTLGMHYMGYLSNGTLFDGNTSASPFSFVLGANTVIQGWEQGIVGMKVGGRRQLVIPPALGYGNSGIGPIPPGAVLIFTVDLLTVQ